jgi:cytochrome c oxidase assembly protein subunit 11
MSEKQQDNPSNRLQAVNNKQLAVKLLVIPVLMFGFGFALVPLYSVFCDVTGLNGKTGRVEAADVDERLIDEKRTVTIKFLANPGNGLPWTFKPLVKEMEVHPGQIYKAEYRASNRSDKDTVGQAIPSVSPSQASLHFNKTECFCFTQQKLKAHETRDMPLRFVIDHNLPKDIVELTLSYTFFNIGDKTG